MVFEFLGIGKFIKRDPPLGDAPAVAAIAIFIEDRFYLLGKILHLRLSAVGDTQRSRKRDERSTAGESKPITESG